jgi:2'-5' RNA ligase
MRLFVAAEIPEPVRDALGSLQSRLKPRIAGARWVPAATMHLTFKFIGEMPEARLPGLRAALGRAFPSADLAPFELRVRGLGVFPSGRRPRVLWAGMTPSLAEMPQRVQQAVDGAAGSAGCPREDRPFKPHLTLARLGEGHSGPEVAALLAASAGEEWGSFEVNSLWLFQSVLHPGGAEHRRLAEYRIA